MPPSDYPRLLRRFYAHHKPSNVPHTEEILRTYAGREHELFAALADKYSHAAEAPVFQALAQLHSRGAPEKTLGWC